VTAGDVTRTIPAYVFPYDSDGLNATLTVTANASGVCGSESLVTPGRPDAWDCLGEANQVYDPCFRILLRRRGTPMLLARWRV
jgi:hypothetical protein